jgi:Rod binding domain-containing protein
MPRSRCSDPHDPMFDTTSTALGLPADLAPVRDASPLKSDRDTPEAIAKAAMQFEALLIGEVLKSAREADGSSWTGSDDDEADSTLMEVSEQQISTALASRGGLGLAKILSAGLSKTSDHFASRQPKPGEAR